MRISDWSSDVCSSDLLHPDRKCGEAVLQVLAKGPAVPWVQQYRGERVIDASALLFAAVDHILEPIECLQDSHCRAASPIEDRKSVVKGKSGSVRVDLGGRRIIKKKRKIEKKIQ